MSTTMSTTALDSENGSKEVAADEGEEVTSVDLEDPSVDGSESSNTKPSKKRRLLIVLGAFAALALVALIVGLAVGLSTNKGSSSSSSDQSESTAKDSSEMSPADNIPSSTTLPTRSESLATTTSSTPTTAFVPFGSHAFLELFHGLEALQGSSYMISNFQDPASPQHMALSWMADEDEISLGTNFSDSPLLRERYAAIVFYYALGGGNWTIDQDTTLRILNNKTSICLWQELCTDKLSCDNGNFPFGFSCLSEVEEGRVTHIDFVDNELVGQLPIEIMFFEKVEHIRLSSNQIFGPIPPEIGLLSYLRILELEFNDLTGPIPPEMGNLVQLTDLYLYENHGLNGTLPLSFANLTKMDTLYLDGTSLTDGMEQAICANIAAFSNLESLWADCLETPEAPREINCTCCDTCCDQSGCEDDKIS